MASYAITSPPSSRQDPGILAQQSDVRCKRGRLCVILIAPAAHTSKGLAKAFVSSAGGKGPENRETPAPLRFRRSLPHLTCTWVVSPRRHYAGARVRASLEPTADSPSDPP
jgi:hypothetical protein